MQSTSQEFQSTPAAERRRPVWRERAVALDNQTNVATFEAGRGDAEAPTLLLIHGLGHWTQAAWDFIAAELETTHRLIGLDLPGFGSSSKPDVTYDLALFRRAVHAVVEAYGIDRFALAGHSLGGLIAADYAGSYPDEVRLLVLIDPAGFLRTPKLLIRIFGSRLITGVMGKIRPSRAFVRRTFETAVYDAASIDEPMHARMLALSQEPAMTRAFARVYRDALKAFLDLPALHAKFAQYKGPALIVWGRNDNYVPIKALDTARRVYPQAAVTIFERCGHCPSMEYPHELAARLVEAGA